jgi:hypothetical protein
MPKSLRLIERRPSRCADRRSRLRRLLDHERDRLLGAGQLDFAGVNLPSARFQSSKREQDVWFSWR